MSARDEAGEILMGMWGNHRSRQAGKYAKKSYELDAMQVGAAVRTAHMRAATAHDHYWFSQGWNAFHKQPYVSAVDATAYAAFQRGWYQAGHCSQSAIEAG